MNSYLLLRSNKQSGPYSLEEIQRLELKAYDLVWVEGKSAAWRYPGEIEELKSFAPPVEEQPFDRFFKKPTQINQPLPLRTVQNGSAEKEDVLQTKPAAQSSAAQPAHASVYVHAPVQPSSISEKESHVQAQAIKQTQTEKPAFSPKQSSERTYQRQSVPAVTMDDEPVQIQEKFSQPLDEIKKQYAEKVLGARRQTSTGGKFVKPFTLGFGIAALLAVGIFIGLSLNNRGSNSTKESQQKDDHSGGEQQTIYHPKSMPLATEPAQQLDNASNGSQLTPEEQAILNAELSGKKKLKPKSRSTDTLHVIKPKLESTSGSVQENIIVSPTESALTKDAVKNNIADYVNVGGTKYSVGTFGGISDLQLTVSNRSLYPLDLVVVEVQYIQSNKKIFKTETLYFRNIGAGSALMQEAPRSPRGVKVQYRITLINSKELGLSYSGI